MENKSMISTVCTNEVIFNETIEQPIDIEFSLPDYLPDINRILKCRAVSRISSKGINGSSVTLDGCATVTVIFSDEKNCIYSYEYQYPFNKNIETTIDLKSSQIECESICEYINCRAVTGRKIDIHGAVTINLKINKNKCSDILLDYDDEYIEINRCSVPATSPVGCAEKYIFLEDNFEIGQGLPSICSILRYDVCSVINECNIIKGKVVVKGETVINLLYSSEQNSIHSIKNVIPFSQLIEIENLNDLCQCECKSDVVFVDIKPDKDDECREFSVNIKLLIKCEAYCNNDIEAISDIFSRKYEIEFEKKELKINKLHKNINEIFSCKKNIDVSECNLSSIADLKCEIQKAKCKFEDRQLILNGILCIGILAFDENSIPLYYEKNIDFEYKNNIVDLIDGEPSCKFELENLSVNYTLTGNGNIELRIELSVNAAIYLSRLITLVSKVVLTDKKIINKDKDFAMSVYFANNGEYIWDIAKKFMSSVGEIKEINCIDNDILINEQTLLIPII